MCCRYGDLKITKAMTCSEMNGCSSSSILVKGCVGSSILVTGGCGFIGSNFISHLLEQTTARIVVYDSLATGSKENVESSDRIVMVVGDVCDRKLLERTLQLYDVEEVVHFAALTHAGDSFQQPHEYIQTNVQGTLCLLETVKKCGGINNLLYVSTDEVFGESTADDTPKDEASHLKPMNPYAVSKVSAEKLVEVYHCAYGIPAHFVRLCNVYGPRQSFDKVIPKFIKQASESQPFTIEGDGKQLRTWLYVDDACKAIYSVLHGGKMGEVYNVGTSFETSILDLARVIMKEVHDHGYGKCGNLQPVIMLAMPKWCHYYVPVPDHWWFMGEGGAHSCHTFLLQATGGSWERVGPIVAIRSCSRPLVVHGRGWGP